MKIYHISLNEYKNYCVSYEFFTDFAAVEKWVYKELKKYCFNVQGKSVYELIDEYNESVEKYGIILTECDIGGLTLVE